MTLVCVEVEKNIKNAVENDEMLKRKDFEETFLPLTCKGKQIWVISKVKQLPFEIAGMALRLADLDVIKYVRICDETLAASSENYPNT